MLWFEELHLKGFSQLIFKRSGFHYVVKKPKLCFCYWFCIGNLRNVLRIIIWCSRVSFLRYLSIFPIYTLISSENITKLLLEIYSIFWNSNVKRRTKKYYKIGHIDCWTATTVGDERRLRFLNHFPKLFQAGCYKAVCISRSYIANLSKTCTKNSYFLLNIFLSGEFHPTIFKNIMKKHKQNEILLRLSSFFSLIFANIHNRKRIFVMFVFISIPQHFKKKDESWQPADKKITYYSGFV